MFVSPKNVHRIVSQNFSEKQNLHYSNTQNTLRNQFKEYKQGNRKMREKNQKSNYANISEKHMQMTNKLQRDVQPFQSSEKY